MTESMLPTALREALDTEQGFRDWIVESPVWALVRRDRARAMIAALRWARVHPEVMVDGTIVALEQEAGA